MADIKKDELGIDNLPGNSQVQKEVTIVKPVSNTQNGGNNLQPQGKDRPKHKQIVASNVEVKKSFFRGLTDNIGATLKYCCDEILVPAAKNMLVDMVHGGADRLIYGEDSRYRRNGRNGGLYNNYTSYYSTAPVTRRRDDPVVITRSNRFDEYVFGNRIDAQETLDEMIQDIKEYDCVRVCDFLELIGHGNEVTNTDSVWGWRDLSRVKPIKVRGGWILDLPPEERV